jgi:hypothetical protein
VFQDSFLFLSFQDDVAQDADPFDFQFDGPDLQGGAFFHDRTRINPSNVYGHVTSLSGQLRISYDKEGLEESNKRAMIGHCSLEKSATFLECSGFIR